MNELKEDLKELIKESYSYFENEKHFEEVDDSICHDEDTMRVFDVGYIIALKMVVNRLEELTTEDYE